MMSAYPCKAGPNGTPCNRIRIGEAYDRARDCRYCYLFAHNARYSRAWGGNGRVTPAPPVVANLPPTAPKRLLLGDAIESALSTVGITKERVSEWLGQPCGCLERQRRLNELHLWARQAGQETIDQARSWLTKLIGSK